MKVLYIVDTLGFGGGKERQLVTLLKEIDKHTDVIPYLIILSDQVSYDDFKSLKVNYTILKKRGFFDLRLFYILIRLVKRYDPDIIHSWEWYSTLAIMPAKIINRIHLVNGSIRNAIPCRVFSKSWIYSKSLFPFSEKVVANSYAGLQAYRKKVNRKYKVIYNGFDIDRVLQKNHNKNDILDNIKSKIIIGMIARFYAQKDHLSLISAINKLAEENYDLSLVMAGGGDMLEEAKKFTASFPKNKDKFIFLGPSSNVEAIISICDICVLSTNVKIHSEGISNSIMEYMAMKKPVVATDDGGNRELISENITGFLVQPFNIEDIADKIKKLIDDKSLREKFGQNGYEKIKNEFSVDRMYENYINLYKEVLK